jgi:hypothetical protein
MATEMEMEMEMATEVKMGTVAMDRVTYVEMGEIVR